MIIKGKFPWYAPDKLMSESAKSLFNILPSIKELPHLPTSVMELQQLIQNPSTSSNNLALVAKKDPMIATNILKIANNIKSSENVAIESLAHAISYIGFKILNEIVIAASVTSFEFKTTIFKAEDFWEESFLVGKIAEFLGRKLNPKLVPDELYLAGALCNIGKVVLAICFPELADKIVKDSMDIKILSSWRQGEALHEASDHCILGEIAASLWGLPQYVLFAAGNHHKLNQSSDDHQEKTNIVALANQFAHWVRLEPNKIDQILLTKLAKEFGLHKKEVENIADHLIGTFAA